METLSWMVTFQRFHPSSSQKLRAAAMMTGELRMGAMRESDTESQAADMHRTKKTWKKTKRPKSSKCMVNTTRYHHLYKFISIYRLVVILVDLISLFCQPKNIQKPSAQQPCTQDLPWNRPRKPAEMWPLVVSGISGWSFQVGDREVI